MTAAALWTKHRRMARSIAHSYYLPGSERQDVEQEALIGLWEAARAWDGVRPFRGFAAFVIHRRLQEKVKVANRLKHGPLTDSKRVGVNDDGEQMCITELLPDPLADVHRTVEARQLLARALPAAQRTEQT